MPPSMKMSHASSSDGPRRWSMLAMLLLALTCLAPATALAQPTITNITQGTVHATIQEAVNAAVDNDEIVIGAGTLVEQNVIIQNKTLAIRGAGPEETTIDAQGVPGRIFNLRTGANATIEGLTLANGFPPNNGSLGGGALRAGGDASAWVRDCAFIGNSAGDFFGGAVYGFSTGDLSFVRCTFRDNIDAGSAESIRSLSGGIALIGCLFETSNGAPRAVEHVTDAPLHVHNCTFAGTPADAHILAHNADIAEAVNSAFSNSAPPFSGNVIWTTSRNLYAGATGDDIDGSPTFVDAANGDYRLAAGSLGIDAADADAYLDAGGNAFELGGLSRFHDDPTTVDTGTGDTGCCGPLNYLDIGAYEYHSPGVITQHPVSVAVIDLAPPAQFTVVANAATNFQWFKDGQAIQDGAEYAGATTATLTVHLPSAQTEGLYTVLVGDGASLDESHAAGLVVRPNPCPGDFNSNGTTDVFDLLAFLDFWFNPCD